MRRAARFAGPVAAALLLAACQTPGQTGGDAPAEPPVTATPEPPPDPPPDPAAAALPPAPPVPHIYLALQPGGEGKPVSAVFAIDAARDNTPSDDPAVRLTPDAGLCNPQEMRNYDFAPEDAARPVVGEAEQAKGLTARDLPAFMAVSVTDKMLGTGLAHDREETRALNICTRKLWERLVATGNRPGLISR